ncbi:MAG TPA: DUF1684 domain-containing protein [Thermoanaerobaculia bacterium]|nr:DUF1684 domain-containing protein [Thermoanaerobaculia bacterium]
MKRMLVLTLLLAACNHESSQAFRHEEDVWRTQRRASLTSPDGWLSLVGLYWLHEGPNDVTLPAHPPVTLHFTLDSGRVTVAPNPRIGAAQPLVMRDDTDPEGPTVLHAGTLSFEAIKRQDASGDRYGVRARDPRSDARTHFKGLDYFPPNSKFRVVARFEPYAPPRKIPITNVLGMTSDEISPGALVFDLGGRTWRIDPILEQGTNDLFIIFKDATSGKETYAAARYLYAHPPDASGKTVVDFNRAYNPPCAFTPYATCPLPPPQNRLPIRVEAGELKYAGGHP